LYPTASELRETRGSRGVSAARVGHPDRRGDHRRHTECKWEGEAVGIGL